MKLIETVELTSSASSITFSSIPQTYTDLVVVISARSDRSTSSDVVRLKPNNSSANGLSIILLGDGSSVSSFTDSSNVRGGTMTASSATADAFGNSAVYISNYTSSAAKSFSTDAVTENNGTFGVQNIYAALWNDTNAITSLVLDSFSSSNLLAGSTFSLYGITAGSDGTTTVT